MKKIPSKIKEAAQYLIDMFGKHVEYLGKYQDAEVYYYNFPEEVTAGASPVFLFRNGEVDELTGDIALHFLDSFVKDVDE